MQYVIIPVAVESEMADWGMGGRLGKRLIGSQEIYGAQKRSF
jgi:hypothetical protein